MAATRATSGTSGTMCGATINMLSLPTQQQQQQQQQDISDLITNSNTTRTIDVYPTTNGTPVRYQCKINLSK